MCSMYWNLTVPCLICPECGALEVASDLQTHFMGDVGDCLNYYKIGEQVPNLRNMTGRLSDLGDCFVTNCNKCDAFLDYDGVVEKGVVTGVSLIKR